MKILMTLFLLFSILFSSDATIEVIKKVDALPTIALEDATTQYDDRFKRVFFKSLVADLNVLSLFNVDSKKVDVSFDQERVDVTHKDSDFVVRYRLYKSDNNALALELKLIQRGEVVFTKRYKISKQATYMFISHTIAYDLNDFMGSPSVEWMKRKVVFSRMVAPQKSEIVIADYTLTYQHTIIKGGFNVFPKWANKAQTGIYFTSLSGFKPTLKYVDITTGVIKDIIASDGMVICSDVSDDGVKLLLTMAPSGQADIYIYNLKKRKYKRITTYGGIDVNGQFLGDDKIVFVSNRLGYPNIFSKDLVTQEIEQLVYYGRSNSACSANGEYIVYKARESSNAFAKNTFNLHLISTKTDFIRRLTATGVNEFPRFSKDGDAILFIKNYKAQSAIGIIRLNHNKNYLFPLRYGKVQAMDW